MGELQLRKDIYVRKKKHLSRRESIRWTERQGRTKLVWLKWFLLGFMVMLIISVISIAAILLSVKTLPIENMNDVDYSSVIYDRNGHEAARLGTEEQEYLSLDQIEKLNPDLPRAIVKVEDQRFFQHHGIDWGGILRAIWANIKAGGKAEGGSTITMQVARNVVLEDQTKSFFRKLKEMKAAWELEEKYDKRKILETYLNHIDFGYQVKGVQMASKIYFGKDLTRQKLEPHEIALLAGLPKAPYGYNPYGTKEQQEKALKRRNVVLMKMAENSTLPPLITTHQKEAYQKKDLGVNKKYLQRYLRPKDFGAYKNLIREEMKERYHIQEEELISDGYRIYTGMNPVAQRVVEQALKDEHLFKNNQNEKWINAAVIMIHPQNGRIEAIGGGRNYHAGNNNWALQPIQPGTVIQPLTVFAPAVQIRGMNEYSKIRSSLGGRSISFGKVVARSLREPAISVLRQSVTVKHAFAYGKLLGFPLSEHEQTMTSLAMGYWNQGISPKDLAQAYTVFPNQGKKVKAHAIIKVVDNQGNEVKPRKGQEIDEWGNPERVFQSRTAWYMTRMLKDAVMDPKGMAVQARIQDGRPVAGYSGSLPNKDNGWFVGFTPDLVTAVAVFNETYENRRGKAEITGETIPARIFSRVMSDALKGKEMQWFQKPNGVKDPKPLIPKLSTPPKTKVPVFQQESSDSQKPSRPVHSEDPPGSEEPVEPEPSTPPNHEEPDNGNFEIPDILPNRRR
ncbi:transglycosylase domain-containing protein [Thermoflavimicrobium dichotomicum]|uniref:Penicillin-binding protein 2A n=1 Tax=Thermoflavimicrobium dichotomicum TaxID=46223 RepID=A0A1I3KK64_9BACL|nr:transglycosylase domain-containing protein [Thermoflavimicrobium dichotomicum]SFI72794.1 penicillin-binding protein 2A [Thermoflavimicrobium dichotomicum]